MTTIVAIHSANLIQNQPNFVKVINDHNLRASVVLDVVLLSRLQASALAGLSQTLALVQ
jgi:hypothetical protein